MPDERREQELAEARRNSDEDAQRDQARDAARIHRELAETERLTAAIDDLLDEGGGTHTR